MSWRIPPQPSLLYSLWMGYPAPYYEYVEDYGVKSLSKLTQIDHNFFLDYLPFEKISWLREFVKNNPTGVIMNSCVINWIE